MRRFSRLSIPEKAHPLVRQLIKEMNHQRIGLTDMAERAGVSRRTFAGWRIRHTPRIAELEACYNVLGLTLVPRRIQDV